MKSLHYYVLSLWLCRKWLQVLLLYLYVSSLCSTALGSVGNIFWYCPHILCQPCRIFCIVTFRCMLYMFCVFQAVIYSNVLLLLAYQKEFQHFLSFFQIICFYIELLVVKGHFTLFSVTQVVKEGFRTSLVENTPKTLVWYRSNVTHTRERMENVQPFPAVLDSTQQNMNM